MSGAKRQETTLTGTIQWRDNDDYDGSVTARRLRPVGDGALGA